MVRKKGKRRTWTQCVGGATLAAVFGCLCACGATSVDGASSSGAGTAAVSSQSAATASSASSASSAASASSRQSVSQTVGSVSTTPQQTTGTDETMEQTLTIGGKRTTLAMIKHTSPLGYSVVYDPSVLTLQCGEENDTYCMKDSEAYFLVSRVQGTTVEAQVESLTNGSDVEGGVQDTQIGTGGYAAKMLSVRTTANGRPTTDVFYVLERDGDVLLIETMYVSSVEKDMSVRMQAMMESLTFLS